MFTVVWALLVTVICFSAIGVSVSIYLKHRQHQKDAEIIFKDRLKELNNLHFANKGSEIRGNLTELVLDLP